MAATATRRRAGTSSEPFSFEHFEWWSQRLILDNGTPWMLDEYQQQVASDVFGGVRETWLVVPEGNGKTTFLAGLALYGLRFAPDALIPIAASSRDQARIMYRQAKGFLRRSQLDDPGFEFQAFDGYRRVDLRVPGPTKRGAVAGSIEIHAADAGTGDGIIPFPFAILDELHRHRTLELYETWRGKLDKRNAQLIAISTAGEPDGDFELTREKIRRETPVMVAVPGFTWCRSDEIAFHEYALEQGADPGDVVAVKRCNPLPSITVESLTAKRKSPTMSDPHWSRFVCNLATRSTESWLDHLLWSSALEPGAEIPEGARVTVGLDVGLVHDSTAVVVVWRSGDDEDRLLLGECRVWDPRESGKVRLSEVEEYLRDLAGRFQVDGVLYDPRFFEHSAEILSDEGLTMVEMQQNSSSMADAYQAFYAMVAEDRVRHVGDPLLTSHVMATAAEMTDRGWKVRKLRQSQRIDACVAAVMACWGAETLVSSEPFFGMAFV